MIQELSGQTLRARGHADTHSAEHQRDVEKLRAHTANELDRLKDHRVLPLDNGIPLARSSCRAALLTAIADGQVLVVGEPGAGKTGVLLDLVAEYTSAGAPVVFISVDRHAGVGNLRGLEQDLRLDGALLDVLDLWPGSAHGILLIDALDASRGGPSENVFATLIDDAARRLSGRWSVVASIRTFDLLNGVRYRALFAGSPPNTAFAHPKFGRLRHFVVPTLSADDLAEAATRSPKLKTLLAGAPPPLAALLCNVFNLSLAASLLQEGADAGSIGSVTTQSELIERYEDIRLARDGAVRAVKATLKEMISQRRLAVREVDVEHDGVKTVLAEGVLVRNDDLVRFAHHILFDHAAARYFLDWSNPERLFAQVGAEPGIGLILGPSIRFALQRMWRRDDAQRQVTWSLFEMIVQAFRDKTQLDPIVTSVALRTVADHVGVPSDVVRLNTMLLAAAKTPDNGRALAAVFSHITRYVKLSVEEAGQPDDNVAISWAQVAEQAATAGPTPFLDGARILLFLLAERSNLSGPGVSEAFGRAARALLAAAWAAGASAGNISTNAIRFVGRSFGSDPQASRNLLAQIINEPRFTAHAHEEVQWLAENVPHIIPYDPDFVVNIYETLFGRNAPTSGDTNMGDSRILRLRSNRKQDYEGAHHHLQMALPAMLRDWPATGLRAVNAAVLGKRLNARDRDVTRVEGTDVLNARKFILYHFHS